jgi:acetyl-CoA carboxylase alpha subunit
MAMVNLRTPVISVVIGEGGSGGALALSVADEIWMLEHSVYSILSPEGFASILWKDAARSREAAQIMKITARTFRKCSLLIKLYLNRQAALIRMPTEWRLSLRKTCSKSRLEQCGNKWRMC